MEAMLKFYVHDPQNHLVSRQAFWAFLNTKKKG